ncbi:hypothetical protein AGDE_12327 [Angomonas deanei]|nr:hypothetical protein AGDE_12327 [Angomonas deanei]|eukprot:EPY24477.1 hypothetical protein AGDE_12327 [Angomonas deanei]
MPPLTLEQVLARSMRLPRQRASQSISSLFSKKKDDETVPTFSHVTSSEEGAPTTSSSMREGRARGDVLSFFKMVEQLDEAKQARNPTFTASHTLVNNGLDLLTHLEAAKRMQTWQDALSLFTQSTNTTVRRSGADWEWSRTSPTATGIVPREEHLCVLLDTLAAGEQWDLIRGIGHYYGKSLPPVLTHVVRLLAYYAPVEGETEEQLAQARCTAAYDYLTHCKVPPPDRPVEAYTECLAACERANDWQGALRIVRSMGPNPLQGWRSAEEGEGEATTSEPVDGLAPPSPTS